MYHIASPYFALRDTPHSYAENTTLAREFDEYYHLFLLKIARIPQDRALSEDEEKRLITLFSKINTLKRQLETN